MDKKEFLQNLSSLPGVYQMLDIKTKTLYVGKAKNLKKRLTSYFTKTLSPKTGALMAQTVEISTTITNTETEALILENNLIKKLKPRYNILLRDDKSYAYMRLSADKFPYISFHRGSKSKSGQYFGPYPSAGAIRESLKIIQKAFKVRQCDNSFFANRSRPCLQYQIKRCTAPCVGYISSEKYAEDIRHTKMLLEGKSDIVTKALEHKMFSASTKQNYEAAGESRDQIQYIRQIQSQQFISGNSHDVDVVALALAENIAVAQVFVFRNGNNLGSRSFFLRNIKRSSTSEVLAAFISQHYLQKVAPDEIIISHSADNCAWLIKSLSKTANKAVKISTNVRGSRAKWLALANKNAKIALQTRLNMHASAIKRLESLQDILKTDASLQTIECFDISHTFGEATVGSCVVFKNGVPAKEYYRKFNIKNIQAGDDYAAMQQTLSRRYTRMVKQDIPLPDLIIIDGGKGQLKQAVEVLAELQINSVCVLGVAKGEGRKPGAETLFLAPNYKRIKLAEEHMALHLIQQIRDEAHRFAISSHRAVRGKARTTSVLQKIPGIGAKRKTQLITHFGGLQEIKKAGAEDLAKVKGISQQQAQKIYDYLHN